VELRALRYFVAVAEERHFGRAAERLHVAQPAVSQQIARLERELGASLLDRSPRKVALTDAGTRVLDAARDALAAADRVAAAARRTRGGATVRIGTAAGLTARLERGIDALRAQHPELELVLADLPLADRLAGLRRGELDLALARGRISGPGLRVLPAWSERLHAVVPAHHPLAGRDAIALQELAGSTLRLPGKTSHPELHDAAVSALHAAGVQPPLGRPAGSAADTVVEIGSSGSAGPGSWALLPAELVDLAGSSRVRSIPLDPPAHVTGCVITVADHLPGCVEKAVEAFRDAAGSHSPAS
jgi:DNA-binding transcriptional LysR family regulator